MIPQKDLREDGGKSASPALHSAIKKDIEPFKISPKRTAEAGEYDRWGGVETRE
jgi:hypothetical protein